MARHQSHVVDRVAARLGVEIVNAFAGGEFGATLVERAGVSLVLKVLPPDQRLEDVALIVGLVDELRALGYPAPRYLDVGVTNGIVHTLQEHAAGSPPTELTVRHVSRLVDLAVMHGEVTGPGGWWRAELAAVLHPDDRRGMHAALRAAGPRVAAIVNEIAAVGATVTQLDVRDDALTHQDFHHRNVLETDGAISAVIDWETGRVADWAFDLVVLSFWPTAAGVMGEDAHAIVRSRLAIERSPAVLAAYAGYLAMRNLDFFRREHPEELDPWFVGVCETLLAPWWREGGRA